jgi:hypothetical protein
VKQSKKRNVLYVSFGIAACLLILFAVLNSSSFNSTLKPTLTQQALKNRLSLSQPVKAVAHTSKVAALTSKTVTSSPSKVLNNSGPGNVILIYLISTFVAMILSYVYRINRLSH